MAEPKPKPKAESKPATKAPAERIAPPPPPPGDLAGPPPVVSEGPTDPLEDDDDNDRTVLAAPRRPRNAWVLVTPDGTRHAIAGVTVVGRRPAKTAFPGSDKSLILKDPEGQMSKSHAVFEVDSEGLWVRDLDSTNGVVVVASTGQETTVSGDARVQVAVGSEVELGRFIVKIEKEGE